MTSGPAGIASRLGRHTPFLAHGKTRRLHDGTIPVDRLAGVVGPGTNELDVTLVKGVADDVVDDILFVNLRPDSSLVPGPNGTNTGAARAVATLVGLDEEGLGTGLGRVAGRKGAGVAGTDHENLAVDGLSDGGLVHVRLGPKPGRFVGGGDRLGPKGTGGNRCGDHRSARGSHLDELTA